MRHAGGTQSRTNNQISSYQTEKRHLEALTSRNDEQSQQNWQRRICTQHRDRKGDVERSGHQHGSVLKAPLPLHSSIAVPFFEASGQ